MSEASVAPDAELIVASLSDDRDAWALLCRRHAPRLAAYLAARLRRPSVVEQLVEDAIVMAWTHLHELPSRDGFPSFLRRIGAKLALQWYRDHADEGLSDGFPVERVADRELAARIARLDAALGLLSDAQRMALEGRFRGGLAGEALAESLHLRDGDAADRLVDDALDALARLLPAEAG